MAVLPKVAQGRWRDSPSPLAGALWKSFLGAVLAGAAACAAVAGMAT